MSETLTPHFAMECLCGAVISAPCEFAEIGATSAAFGAKGWGIDPHGFVACPDCLRAGFTVERQVQKPEPAQAYLFGEAP